jgi:hypothetical protein
MFHKIIIKLIRALFNETVFIIFMDIENTDPINKITLVIKKVTFPNM